MEAILTEVVPKLAKDGVFGDCLDASVSVDNDEKLGAQFSSEICFATIYKDTYSGNKSNIPIVIKTLLQNSKDNDFRDIGTMFYNEVVMYKELLPFLDENKANFYPKMYYFALPEEEKTGKTILILENMIKLGFSIPKVKLFLDFEHISFAMRRLGVLHAWSYKAKKLYKNEFFLKIKNLRTPITKSNEEFDFDLLAFNSISNGIEPLIEKNIETETLNKFLQVFKSLGTAFEILMKPEEPFSVVCHGDFCNNNILYNYSDSGGIIDCVFFDFQLSKYSSPAIDLAFYLYMHTTAEIRDKHWDDFLKIYYTSVRETVPQDIQIPSYEDFLEHFASRAVYGYIPCSFFTPMMMLDKPLTTTEVQQLSKEEQINYFRKPAGEKGSKVVTDIVSHMLERKYISKFLDYYRSNLTDRTLSH